MHDNLMSGWRSVLTDELVGKSAVYDARRLTLEELSAMVSQHSRSLLHETITEILGLHKLCARWPPPQTAY